MGSVMSGVIFMFMRSFLKCQIQISEEKDIASQTTDHLESNHIVLELNDSNLTPLFASICLLNDNNYQPSADIELCMDLFFVGQVFQAVGFLFWSFTEFYSREGSYWRNTFVPQLIRYACKLIFEWIPGAKVFIYLIYVYRSSLLHQIAAPFLLMSTVNCIFILLVWYKTIVTPFLEKKLKEL